MVLYHTSGGWSGEFQLRHNKETAVTRSWDTGPRLSVQRLAKAGFFEPCEGSLDVLVETSVAGPWLGFSATDQPLS